MTHDDLRSYLDKGSCVVLGHEFSGEDLKVTRNVAVLESHYSSVSDGATLVVADTRLDESLKNEGFAREFVNRIQKLRKKVCSIESYCLPRTSSFVFCINLIIGWIKSL